MACHENEGSCETQKSCGTGAKKEEECCTLAEYILCLAECAKHELLKQKIMKALEAKIGKKLDKVAEAAADALLAGIEHKISGKMACDSYKEKLRQAFMG